MQMPAAVDIFRCTSLIIASRSQGGGASNWRWLREKDRLTPQARKTCNGAQRVYSRMARSASYQLCPRCGRCRRETGTWAPLQAETVWFSASCRFRRGVQRLAWAAKTVCDGGERDHRRACPSVVTPMAAADAGPRRMAGLPRGANRSRHARAQQAHGGGTVRRQSPPGQAPLRDEQPGYICAQERAVSASLRWTHCLLAAQRPSAAAVVAAAAVRWPCLRPLPRLPISSTPAITHPTSHPPAPSFASACHTNTPRELLRA